MKREQKMAREIRRDYQKLLKDPRWLDFAFEVIEEKGPCAWCGSEDQLQVHHLVYYQNTLPWEYSFEDVEVLCSECHTRIHVIVDECWVQMLKLNETQLELLLKTIKEVRTGETADVTRNLIGFFRNALECPYDRSIADTNNARRLLQAHRIADSAHDAENLPVGSVVEQGLEGKRTCPGGEIAQTENAEKSENNNVPEV